MGFDCSEQGERDAADVGRLIAQCDAEVAASLTVHTKPAWEIAIWANDWEVEKRMIMVQELIDREKSARGTAAAKRMMAERGYVVIGFPPESCPVIGRYATNFACAELIECRLVIDSETNREDWESQCTALFGNSRKASIGDNAARKGEVFFRCSLHTAEDTQ